MKELLLEAASAIKDARSIAVLTGAGISAPSGVPTFRDPGGLWKEFTLEELATVHGFNNDPKRVWDWYLYRREKVRTCKPNRAHEVLSAWQKIRPLTLITQNVDGLHERAGSDPIIRFHGSLFEERCIDNCGYTRLVEVEVGDYPPVCPGCREFLRPGVVWFGEMIDPQVLEDSYNAAKAADVFLVIGTSAEVFPAAGLIDFSRAHGARVIEINLTPTSASKKAHIALHGSADEVLSSLEESLLTLSQF